VLDWPFFGDALWKVSDQLGIRPEWQLPVISLETAGTFDPAITNPGGCVGLNQFCPSTYSRYVSVPVAQYRAWPASRQLAGPIFNYWRDATRIAPIHSAVKLLLAQLSQRLLRTAPALDSIVFAAPSTEYSANSGFDTSRKGYITVQDLANALSPRARSVDVRDLIARAYSMRPGERPFDPVYGTDFGDRPPMELILPPAPVPLPKTGGLFAATGVIAMVAAAAFGASKLKVLSRVQ